MFRQSDARKRNASFVPLEFDAGDAMQFDWSTEELRIGGKRIKVMLAHAKLCFSRAFFLTAYPRQAHEMLFESHARAFGAFGGVPRRCIYDNMRTAVDKCVGGRGRVINQHFSAMAAHYLFEPEFCNVAAGWEKGIVEKNVRDRRAQLIVRIQNRPWRNFEELNAWLADECRSEWGRLVHPIQTSRKISEVLDEERELLFRTTRPFDGYVEILAKVTSTILIMLDRNRYSVPSSLAGGVVTIRKYAWEVVVTTSSGPVARHPRDFGEGQVHYDWRHYLWVIRRKPGALRDGAPFKTMPSSLRQLSQVLGRQEDGNLTMVEVLTATEIVGVPSVMAMARRLVVAGYPTVEHVREELRKLVDQCPAQLGIDVDCNITTPATSNVERYDELAAATRSVTVVTP